MLEILKAFCCPLYLLYTLVCQDGIFEHFTISKYIFFLAAFALFHVKPGYM